MKILLELRPALSGHAGIPQETRLLFRGLSQIDGLEVEGLIQSTSRVLSKGLPANPKAAARLPHHKRIDRLSRVVVALQEDGQPTWTERAVAILRLAFRPSLMVLGSLLGFRQPLDRFEPAAFKDFVWRAMFAKTLPHDDFEAVTSARYRMARIPWSAMHACALATNVFGHAVYPRLATGDFDLMIGETPYPGRVSGKTRLIVRYHDAIPLLMPHTISDKIYHQASHYQALRRNVRDGAWFACVSEATRRDLLSVFPEAEPRAVTVPNMVSHHYFRDDSTPDRVPEVLRMRRSPALAKAGVAPGAAALRPVGSGLDYILMVSTIEPRKNHLTLLAAWEQLRHSTQPDMQLVLVGSPGWDHKAIIGKLLPWIGRGSVHLLEDVPAPELRMLYRHARATVCPSFGEGFDYSGVEAMRCGGIVAASDIPVHREVFGDAAEYFNPYAANEIARALESILAPGAGPRREALIRAGQRVSAAYLPERVLPQWRAFLHRVAGVPDPAASVAENHADARAMQEQARATPEPARPQQA
jgi:glycosyltransferase involved in cell wall biosynthesis